MTSIAQEELAKVLAGIPERNFLDDIIVATKEGEDHGFSILQVLEKLTYEFNIKLNLKKFLPFCQEANILGFICKPDGISVDPKKAATI